MKSKIYSGLFRMETAIPPTRQPRIQAQRDALSEYFCNQVDCLGLRWLESPPGPSTYKSLQKVKIKSDETDKKSWVSSKFCKASGGNLGIQRSELKRTR